MLHLCGNTTQWIMAQFTEVSDQRQRDAEFATEHGLSVAELSTRLREVYTTISPDDILEARPLPGLLFGESLADDEPRDSSPPRDGRLAGARACHPPRPTGGR